MITLEQIKHLDREVTKAVQTINMLQAEKRTLSRKLGNYEQRIQELEKLINDFKENQGEIEQGILNALSRLDSLESEIESKEPDVQDESQAESMEDPMSTADGIVPGIVEESNSSEDIPPETILTEEHTDFTETTVEELPKTEKQGSELDIF